jgi:peroxiredoxin Q/BCP
MLHINDQAPDFTLLDEQDTTYSLSALKGKKIILYFYPKDDTAGCTTEACSFRDHFTEIQEKGVLVLGIGKGTKRDHIKFIEKHNLPFHLLVDKGLEVCNLYQVLVEKSMYGKPYQGIKRTTFLIDNSGKITHVWENVDPINHAAEVLKTL